MKTWNLDSVDAMVVIRIGPTFSVDHFIFSNGYGGFLFVYIQLIFLMSLGVYW